MQKVNYFSYLQLRGKKQMNSQTNQVRIHLTTPFSPTLQDDFTLTKEPLQPQFSTQTRYKMDPAPPQAVPVEPKPTSVLLDETPRHEVVDEILEDFRIRFSSVEETLAWRLDAELVFLKERRSNSRKRARP